MPTAECLIPDINPDCVARRRQVYFYFSLQLLFPNLIFSHPAITQSVGRNFVTAHPLLTARMYSPLSSSPPQTCLNSAIANKQNLPANGYSRASNPATQEWPNTPLTVLESRHSGRSKTYAPLEYEYDDRFGDVRAVGDAQFSRSHIINGGKKKSGRRQKVHRYPEPAQSQESHSVPRYPDVGDDASLEPLPPIDGLPEELPETDLANFQPQPSNDYADEAEPDYDDEGYGDDDDDEDDSETRSRTFVASGTGRIPDDMRPEVDDLPDTHELAADAFLNDREREGDLSIHRYNQDDRSLHDQ